jgi:RNA polymerase sigma-70 factor (ECF subfamily)
MDEQANITFLLRRLAAGDATAERLLFPLIHSELRRLAGSLFRRERPGHTLQPTALVNEAYLRLAGQENVDWKCRAHFFAVAASTMRRVLIDHARKNRAEKRGAGGQRVVLEDL